MMYKVVVLLALGFTVTLAAIIGTRMSAEALAVVTGVVCGVLAAIPVSLLILAICNRRQQLVDKPKYGQPDGARYGPFPPVVVIQGGAPSNALGIPSYYPVGQTMVDSAPRLFHVVGGEED